MHGTSLATQLTVSPNPIAAPGSLAPAAQQVLTVTAADGTGTAVPGATVYLSANLSGAGASVTSGTVTLSSKPARLTANAQGQITATYHVGTGSAGFDQVIAGLAVSSVDASAEYDYTAGGHAGFVYWLYHDLLNRAPDSRGLAWATGLLNRGAPRREIVTKILNSHEYADDVARALYSQTSPSFKTYPDMLGRPIDSGYWGNQIAAGLRPENVETAIAASAEYWRVRGQNDADAYVNALFNDFLGRSAGPGHNYWSNALINGQMSGGDAAWGIMTSREGRANLANRGYQALLHRPADAAGMGYWAHRFVNGLRISHFIALVAASDEYLNYANTHTV